MKQIAVALTILTLPSAALADILFDGAATPEEQGWSVGASTLTPPYPFFSDGSVYDMNTIDAPGNPVHLWARDVGITVEDGFTLDFSLRVIDDTVGHNLFDAPIAFMAHYVPPIGDRSQMIYFDEDEIGWGDQSERFLIDTTDAFHTYTLTVDPTGLAQFFVEGHLALQRADFITDGIIAFGDQTNDPGVDGHFQLEFITLVPAPPAFVILALVLWRPRNRRVLIDAAQT